MRLPVIASALLFASSPAFAGPSTIHIEQSWARAGTSSSAAYVTIHNGGRQTDRLIGASSPAARNVSIHNTSTVGGVMRMRGAGPLPIAAGGRLTMKSGGTHVMLVGLKQPLRPGTRLPLTLRFEKAGSVQVSVPVLPPGSSPAAAKQHHDH